MEQVSTTMEDRIRQLMEASGLSQKDYAAKLEISPGSLSSIFNGRTRATNNFTKAIHRAFPTVNINWLLFGEGEMFGSSDGLAPSGASDPSLQSSDGNMSAPDLFSANTEQYPPLVQPTAMPRREDNGYGKIHPDVIQKINYVDKPVRRKIKEIRVFYSDGTFESFAPQED